MPPKHTYFSELDGIRALAALMIMVFHGVDAGLPLRGPVTFGQTGVDLFFILSGFLITSILLRSNHGDWGEVRTFYIRRSLRIFPLYYAFLIAMALTGDKHGWPFWAYLQNFWFSFNWPLSGQMHLWSLAVEEQFYLVWPFLVLFAPRRRLLPILWTMIIGAVALRYAIAAAGHDVFFLTFTRVDGLAAGAVLAVYHSRGILAKRRHLSGWGFLIFFALVLVVGMRFRSSSSPAFAAVKYSLIVGMYASLLWFVVTTRENWFSGAMRWRPLRFIGRISYGLYIFHPPVFAAVFGWLAGYSWWLRGPAGLVAVFALALLSWYGFERHFIRLKDRWAPERRPTPAAPLAV